MDEPIRFPYGKTFLLGFGFLGISVIWPLFNNFVPIFLRDLGLSATLIGFVMTWDNYVNMFLQPVVGLRSDQTRTRLGRRKPWMLVGAPLAALAFILIPALRSLAGMMFAIFMTNTFMALFRSPVMSLLGDLYPKEQRSLANAIIYLMGGLGSAVAFGVGGALYAYGRITPFVFGSILLVVSIGVVALTVREPVVLSAEQMQAIQEQRAEKRPSLLVLPRLLSASNRAGWYLLAAMICVFMSKAIETWISSFGKYTLGIDEGRVAMIVMILPLMFILFSFPAGYFANRFGRQRLLLLGMLGLAACFAYGLLVQNALMLVLFLIPSGVCWSLVNVNSLPIMYDIGGDKHIGAMTGLYYFASNFSAVAGPQGVGILVDLTGGNYRVMFGFSLLFMLLACGFMLKAMQVYRHGHGEQVAGEAY